MARRAGTQPHATRSDLAISDLTASRPGDRRPAGDELTRGGLLPQVALRQALSGGGQGNLLAGEQ